MGHDNLYESVLPARGRRTAFLPALAFLWLVISSAAGEPSRSFQVRYHCEPSIGRGDPSPPGGPRLGRELPYHTLRILLPPGSGVDSYRATPSVPSDPCPLPPISLPRPGPSLVSRVRRGTTPAALELVSVQHLAGWPVVVFRLFPWRDGKGEAVFVSDWTVTVATRASGSVESDLLAASGAAAVRERLVAIVDNPGLLPQEPAQVLEGRCDYLVVTRAALAGAFEPLLVAKRRSGWVAEVLTLESLPAGVPGRDVAERLRDRIHGEYVRRGLRWVLLGGDTSVVPTRMAYLPRGGTPAECLVPADLYFGCLDGSWNRDGNNQWGEPTDGEDGGDVDLLPEVDVGRAPVRTPEEVAAFVDKTLVASRVEPGSRRRALLLGSDLEHGGVARIETFQPLRAQLGGWEVRELADRPGSPRWTAADAILGLNDSPSVVCFNGHGDPESAFRLGPADLVRLANDKPFLFSSIGCEIGRFDRDAHTPPSMGERLVTLPRTGAFAAVVNARAGWFDALEPGRYSNELQVEFYRQLLSGRGVPLGRAVAASKEAFLGALEVSGSMPYRGCYLQWTLLGDPEARVGAGAE